MNPKIRVAAALVAAVLGGGLPLRGGLAASGTGTIWQTVPCPDPGGVATLTGVAASSPGDAWVVGIHEDTGLTLAEHWNGTAWTVAATPNPLSQPGEANYLRAVADLSPTDAWAVGFSAGQAGAYGIITSYQPLIIHWDGMAWTTSAPAAYPYPFIPWGVAAVSAKDVWAVGSAQGQGLIEHWDGTAWSVVPSPSDYPLTAVTAISASDVWATGEGSQPIFEHWDGTVWSVVPSPPVSASRIYINGITAASSTDVWAVGFTSSASGAPYQTLSEHWDGRAWSIVRSPDPIRGNNLFLQVAAVSNGDVWAVGYGYASTGGADPLLANWNGKKWQLVTAPVPIGTQDNELFAVTVLSNGTAWGAGDSDHEPSTISSGNA